MTHSNHDGDEPVFDATPYLKLEIDKDGRWFQNGAEIIHRQIYLLFYENLERTEDGGYRVRIGRESCRVEVEDAPFVVLEVDEDPDRGLQILLNDGSREPLDPRQFWIGEQNVPYTRVKDGVFHARFSRPAYYQVANHIESDDNKTFYINVRGERIPIATPTGDSGPDEQTWH